MNYGVYRLGAGSRMISFWVILFKKIERFLAVPCRILYYFYSVYDNVKELNENILINQASDNCKKTCKR